VIIATVIDVLLAVLFAVIGALVLRGNRVGRILAWIFAGLGALCTACLTAAAGLSSQLTNSNTNGVDINALNNQINAAKPSYLTPVLTTVQVISLLALILVIILLALPASHPFFRKEPEAVIVNDPAFPSMPYPPSAPPSDFPPPGNPPPGNPPSA
jgi:hypothetical protein